MTISYDIMDNGINYYYIYQMLLITFDDITNKTEMK